jgi:hypothetical protein
MSDSHVYVRCNDHHWVPARVVETKGDKAVVSIPQYSDEQNILSDGGRGAIKFNRCEINLRDYANGVLPLQNVDEMGWLNDEQDMVDLPFLHEVSNNQNPSELLSHANVIPVRPESCTTSSHGMYAASHTPEQVTS